MSLLENDAPTSRATAEALYVLLYTAEDGWALISRHREQHPFDWTPLAGHGASPTAPPQIAQAMAARVLVGWGVTVRNWDGPEDAVPHDPSTRRRAGHLGRSGRFRAVPEAPGS